MKKLFLLLFLSFSLGTFAASPIAHAKGKVSVDQNGDKTLNIKCSWHFWIPCWTLYDDGHMLLGDGRIVGGAQIVNQNNCDNPNECEYSSEIEVSYTFIEG